MKNSNYQRKALQTMKKNGLVPVLGDTLDALGKSRNKLAVEAKIRPLTVNEIAAGDAKSISFDTITAILNALDVLADGSKRHDVSDIFKREESAEEDTELEPPLYT